MSDQSKLIREALVANLSAVLTEHQVSPYVLSNPTPPCAYVSAGGINYDLAMGRGLDQLSFSIVVLVGFTTDIGAQQKLDEMRSPSGGLSIKEAVESDCTLQGACDDLRVVSVSAPQLYAGQDGRMSWGAEWTVEILATG